MNPSILSTSPVHPWYSLSVTVHRWYGATGLAPCLRPNLLAVAEGNFA